MPRARPSSVQLQRQTTQMVAAQSRDVAGAVQTVVEVAEAIDASVDGGLIDTLNYKLVDLDARLAALELPAKEANMR